MQNSRRLLQCFSIPLVSHFPFHEQDPPLFHWGQEPEKRWGSLASEAAVSHAEKIFRQICTYQMESAAYPTKISSKADQKEAAFVNSEKLLYPARYDSSDTLILS